MLLTSLASCLTTVVVVVVVVMVAAAEVEGTSGRGAGANVELGWNGVHSSSHEHERFLLGEAEEALVVVAVVVGIGRSGGGKECAEDNNGHDDACGVHAANQSIRFATLGYPRTGKKRRMKIGRKKKFRQKSPRFFFIRSTAGAASLLARGGRTRLVDLFLFAVFALRRGFGLGLRLRLCCFLVRLLV